MPDQKNNPPKAPTNDLEDTASEVSEARSPTFEEMEKRANRRDEDELSDSKDGSVYSVLESDPVYSVLENDPELDISEDLNEDTSRAVPNSPLPDVERATPEEMEERVNRRYEDVEEDEVTPYEAGKHNYDEVYEEVYEEVPEISEDLEQNTSRTAPLPQRPLPPAPSQISDEEVSRDEPKVGFLKKAAQKVTTHFKKNSASKNEEVSDDDLEQNTSRTSPLPPSPPPPPPQRSLPPTPPEISGNEVSSDEPKPGLVKRAAQKLSSHLRANSAPLRGGSSLLKNEEVSDDEQKSTFEYNIDGKQKEHLESLKVIVDKEQHKLYVEVKSKRHNFLTPQDHEKLQKEFRKKNIEHARDPVSGKYNIEIDVADPNWREQLGFALERFDVGGRQREDILAKAEALDAARKEREANKPDVVFSVSDRGGVALDRALDARNADGPNPPQDARNADDLNPPQVARNADDLNPPQDTRSADDLNQQLARNDMVREWLEGTPSNAGYSSQSPVPHSDDTDRDDASQSSELLSSEEEVSAAPRIPSISEEAESALRAELANENPSSGKINEDLENAASSESFGVEFNIKDTTRDVDGPDRNVENHIYDEVTDEMLGNALNATQEGERGVERESPPSTDENVDRGDNEDMYVTGVGSIPKNKLPSPPDDWIKENEALEIFENELPFFEGREQNADQEQDVVNQGANTGPAVEGETSNAVDLEEGAKKNDEMGVEAALGGHIEGYGDTLDALSGIVNDLVQAQVEVEVDDASVSSEIALEPGEDAASAVNSGQGQDSGATRG